MDKIKMPDLSIDMPDKSFYILAALETQKRIKKRTQTDGKDYKGKAFKPYSKEYAKFRASKGRSKRPNLSFTSRMLGAMKSLATNRKGMVVISGKEQVGKVKGNEARGRTFFAFAESDRDKVYRLCLNWMTKKNKFKR